MFVHFYLTCLRSANFLPCFSLLANIISVIESCKVFMYGLWTDFHYWLSYSTNIVNKNWNNVSIAHCSMNNEHWTIITTVYSFCMGPSLWLPSFYGSIYPEENSFCPQALKLPIKSWLSKSTTTTCWWNQKYFKEILIPKCDKYEQVRVVEGNFSQGWGLREWAAVTSLRAKP